MIIVGIFIIYCIVGLVVSILAYKFTKKVKYSILVIIFFTLLPTWDLLIQKAVKEYYVTFKMEPKIYAYPEKDENGKIESLGLIDVKRTSYESMVSRKKNDDLSEGNFYKNNIVKQQVNKNKIKNLVNNYYEIDTDKLDNKGNLNSIKWVKIYTNDNQKEIFEFIDKRTARYQVKSKIHEYLFGLYKKKIFKIVDIKNNKVLAEAIYVDFTKKFSYFRNNFLCLSSGNGIGMFYVKNISNLDEIFTKVFKIKINLYERKGL